MTADYPIDEVPATPEYVLELFRDWSRVEVFWPKPEEPYPDFDTPLQEWLDSLDFDPPSARQLRVAVNYICRADITRDEWRRFKPERATVGEVCRLVAIRGRRPAFRPWRFVGGECLPAGVFLTIRSLLRADGADPKSITPSAPLAPHHPRLIRIQHDLSRLAPGRRPQFLWSYPTWLERIGCAWLCIGLISCLVGAILFVLGFRETAYILVCAVITRSIGLHMMMRLNRIPHVHPDHVLTFRDLAYALAGEHPQRQGA